MRVGQMDGQGLSFPSQLGWTGPRRRVCPRQLFVTPEPLAHPSAEALLVHPTFAIRKCLVYQFTSHRFRPHVPRQPVQSTATICEIHEAPEGEEM